MDNLRFFFRKVLLPACLIFTVLCFVFSAILQASGTEMKLPTINLGNLCQIFAFSLIFSASGLLFTSKKIKYALALPLHFLCFLANLSVVFFLVGKHFDTPRSAFLVLAVFALVYIIIAAIASAVRHIVLSGRNEKKSYKRLY